MYKAKHIQEAIEEAAKTFKPKAQEMKYKIVRKLGYRYSLELINNG